MSSEKLTTLLEKRKQLDARIKAAQAKERTQQRKDDTRRKIIAGALALEHMETNADSDFAAQLMRLINRYVVKPKDRALFNLPPLNGENPPAAREDFKMQR